MVFFKNCDDCLIAYIKVTDVYNIIAIGVATKMKKITLFGYQNPH
jgi:hypothetical protein